MGIMKAHSKYSKHPTDFPLKQIEYRSFLKAISLYHYAHYYFPIAEFEKCLVSENVGFVRRLESTDLFINEDGSEKILVPKDDEVPDGFTEVAYLKNVFRDHGANKGRSHGSALGFRMLDEDRIEWFCFSGTVDPLLETLHNGKEQQFNLVAHIDRGAPGVNYKGKMGGYLEHSLWYESLRGASKPLLALEVVETNRVRPIKNLVFNKYGQGVEDPNSVKPLALKVRSKLQAMADKSKSDEGSESDDESGSDPSSTD